MQTGLVNLFLWNSPNGSITDEGLGCLASLRRLETFRLEGSDSVTDAGWVRFAAAHSALTRVDLVKCPLVTGGWAGTWVRDGRPSASPLKRSGQVG